MLNSGLTVQVSDTTKAHSSNTAKYIKKAMIDSRYISAE